MKVDVVVLGAGVIGLSSAWKLASKGLQVVVVEKFSLHSGTSYVCGGMLAPNAEAKFTEPELLHASIESLELWKDFRNDLELVSGLTIGYRDEGTLMVALERDDVALLDHAKSQHHALGLKTQVLSADEVREREPNLSPRILRGMYCEDFQVEPPKLMEALIEACRKKGVHIFDECGDSEIGKNTLKFGTTEISYTSLLIATGAWRVKRPDAPKVKPIKGQMVVLDMPTPICDHIIRAPDAYLVPKADRLLIGATMEEMGFDKGSLAGSVMDLLVGAWEAMPSVYDLNIRELCTGHRPVGETSMPYLGRSELDENVFYATGHGRNGVLLTPWTANKICDEMVKIF